MHYCDDGVHRDTLTLCAGLNSDICCRRYKWLISVMQWWAVTDLNVARVRMAECVLQEWRLFHVHGKYCAAGVAGSSFEHAMTIALCCVQLADVSEWFCSQSCADMNERLCSGCFSGFQVCLSWCTWPQWLLLMKLLLHQHLLHFWIWPVFYNGPAVTAGHRRQLELVCVKKWEGQERCGIAIDWL